MKRINFVPYACRIDNNSKSTRFLTVAGEREESGLLFQPPAGKIVLEG